MVVYVVNRYHTDSWNSPPPSMRAIADSFETAKRWIQDEVDGKHKDSNWSYMEGKDADWWLAYGTFSIKEVNVLTADAR